MPPTVLPNVAPWGHCGGGPFYDVLTGCDWNDPPQGVSTGWSNIWHSNIGPPGQQDDQTPILLSPAFSKEKIAIWGWQTQQLPRPEKAPNQNYEKRGKNCRYNKNQDSCGVICLVKLTHSGRDKKDAISQTTFSNAFSWMKKFEFPLQFHWSLFLRVQLTIFQHWFR